MTLRFVPAFAVLTIIGGTAVAEPSHFVVFGDLQDETAEGRERDRLLVEAINETTPAFSVFIGDIKGGGPCTDALFDEVGAIFEAHGAPLVYTPGDNEWTDCWRESAGGYEPTERKAAVVDRFTAKGSSLGAEPMALEQQEGAQENARWQWRDVLFATLHMTGSNNNLQQREDAIAEHVERDALNQLWLDEAFAEAAAQDAVGLALFIHGNPQWDANWWQPTGFDRFRAQLAAHAEAFDGPIIVVHGDTHTFRVDKPFDDAPNVTRVEVFGPPQRGAVLIEVDPEAPEVFRFTPLLQDG